MKYRILKEVNGEFVDTGEVLDTLERIHAKAQERAQALIDDLQQDGCCYAAEAIKERKPKAKKRK